MVLFNSYLGVHAFLKYMSLKVDVISQLEFELTYSNVAVQYFNHCKDFQLDRLTCY